MASVLAGASMAAVLGLGLEVPVVAASGLRVSVNIGSCFSVWVPPLTPTTVLWKAADGRRKALLEQTSDTNGMVSDASICSTESVASGDRITATAGSANRTLTVPVLTATFDRVSGHVRGQAPAGDRLLILPGIPRSSRRSRRAAPPPSGLALTGPSTRMRTASPTCMPSVRSTTPPSRATRRS